MTVSSPIPVLVLGTGKIGRLVCQLLATSGDYAVTAVDLQAGQAEAAVRDADGRSYPNARGVAGDFTDPATLVALGQGQRYMVSCAPYRCNLIIAEAAKVVGAHYLDLTEDVNTTKGVMRLAQDAATAFIPQCGLAPGFISIVAAHLAEGMAPLEQVHLRVGALPQHPNNVLKYSLTWSTDGLINEYGNPCQALVDGREVEVAPLEGLEEIEIDGTLYEAFNTSGGLGSLAETHGGKSESMNYKTIRYPGHCEHMRLLMNDLKLNQDRATLKRVLENAVPQTLQDVVIVYAAVTGFQDGQLREENYVNKVYPQVIAGRLWSAIQVTTASGITAVVDLVLSDPARFKGFVAQEQFSLPAILANRFGRYYAPGGTKDISSDAVVSGKAGQQRKLRGAA